MKRIILFVAVIIIAAAIGVGLEIRHHSQAQSQPTYTAVTPPAQTSGTVNAGTVLWPTVGSYGTWTSWPPGPAEVVPLHDADISEAVALWNRKDAAEKELNAAISACAEFLKRIHSSYKADEHFTLDKSNHYLVSR